MPKYRGRVDCFLNPPVPDKDYANPLNPTNSGFTNRAMGEMFINIVQHLSSSSDLGIEMIAANYGVGSTGFDFWDTGTPGPGPRAWACFRFHSASLGKFDCLLFICTGSFNTSYGGPILNGRSSMPVVSDSTALAMGISFACHPSGSNVSQTDGPWNGTYDLVSASLGNPIWKVNSQGKGAFFSRLNGNHAFHSGSRNYMTQLFENVNNLTLDFLPIRHHVIASEDSLTLLHEWKEMYGETKVLHFGSFLPRPGTIQDSPYVMFVNEYQGGPVVPGLIFSDTSGVDGGTNALESFGYGQNPVGLDGYVANSDALADGGVSHPNLLSGSRKFYFTTAPFGAMNPTTTTNIDAGTVFNSFSDSSIIDSFPLWVAMYETTNNFAILGTMNHISISGPIRTGTVTLSSSSAVFSRGRDKANSSDGSAFNADHDVCLIVPWKGPPPKTSRQRTGRTFSIG